MQDWPKSTENSVSADIQEDARKSYPLAPVVSRDFGYRIASVLLQKGIGNDGCNDGFPDD